MRENSRKLSGIGRAFLAFALLVAGCATPGAGRAFEPPAAALRLADLMARRLEIVRHVAWVKFQNGAPVSDPKREAEVLASLVRQGGEMGLPAEEVKIFFTAQIRASGKVQEELIRGWKRGAALPAFPPWDLRRHIRPKLDEISAEMLVSLKELSSEDRNELRGHVVSKLRQRGFSRSVSSIAASPLH